MIPPEKRRTFETSALEILYGGQFPSSTWLITPDYLVNPQIDAAPEFLENLLPTARGCGVRKGTILNGLKIVNNAGSVIDNFGQFS